MRASLFFSTSSVSSAAVGRPSLPPSLHSLHSVTPLLRLFCPDRFGEVSLVTSFRQICVISVIVVIPNSLSAETGVRAYPPTAPPIPSSLGLVIVLLQQSDGRGKGRDIILAESEKFLRPAFNFFPHEGAGHARTHARTPALGGGGGGAVGATFLRGR